MQLKPEYAHLVTSSKVGVGVQGPTSLDTLASLADTILVLEGDIKDYVPRFGSRCIVRIMHDSTSWKDIYNYAEHCMAVIDEAYPGGVRDYIFGNEQIALEGLGESADDYRYLASWGLGILDLLRRRLADRGISDVRFWGPALSPGHGEDDGIGGYRLMAPYLNALDGIAGHYYWRRDGGWLDDPDGGSWAGRILQAHSVVEGLGIVKPWIISEFNRAVDLGDEADVRAYAEQTEQYYRFVNSLPWCVGAYTFLYCNVDPAFNALSWVRMPKMLDLMGDGWDRTAELAVPGVPAPQPEPPAGDDLVAHYGEGFARVLRAEGATIGEPVAERVDIATTQQAPPGTDPYRFSHLQTERGTLLWRKKDNAMIFWPFGGKPASV